MKTAFRLISLLLCSLFAYAADESELFYSYGLHDFVIDDNSHTMGINGGIDYRSRISQNLTHRLSFDTLAEYDPYEHDSDHIPVWFKGEYHLKSDLLTLTPSLHLDGYGDILWKMNTVFGIEQNFKAGAGVGMSYLRKNFAVSLKVLATAYYNEFDDDKPREQGYSRSELVFGFVPSVTYATDLRYAYKSFATSLHYYMWRRNEERLEEYAQLECSLKKDEKSTLLLTLDYSNYNLDLYRKHPLPIVPWKSDLLITLAIRKAL